MRFSTMDSSPSPEQCPISPNAKELRGGKNTIINSHTIIKLTKEA